jgi:hypothetical protein
MAPHRQKVAELYLRGEIPVHLFAEAIGETLASLYHRNLCNNAAGPNPLRHFPLMVRHGARSAIGVAAPPVVGRRLSGAAS